MYRHWGVKGGFALPTVLIASVVMLMVLTVSVSSVVAIRTALQTQYYEQLAKTAGEAGVAYAKACLAKNGNVPLWSDVKPLTPATDCAGNSLLGPEVDVLVVGGGGGGGGTIAGGGGGGGVVEQNGFDVSVGSYAVTVGSGGLGGLGWDYSPSGGASGTGSSFAGSVTALGGGGGGSHARVAPLVGASGGGGTNGYINGAAGTVGQGYAGGSHPSNGADTGGGGGGAGGPGLASTTTRSGDGGPGKASTITGAVVYYGGGGGGGARSNATAGIGGIGGGGIGTNASALATSQAGQPNTGGGGAGGGHNGVSTSARIGGNGGSGVVIVRYPIGALTATGGTITNTGLYRVHTFTGSGTFQVTSVSTASCPTDPRCSVVAEGNIRSSFSVGKPTLDAEGKAVAIPNTGYVELLRSSNGAVWRTYRQPSVQAAIIPGLCSGAATSSLGWSNAQVVSTQTALPSAPAARNISIADGDAKPGIIYFRKDFQVSQAGTYTVSVNSPSANDVVSAFIDNTAVISAQGSLQSGTASLSAGCHTIVVQLNNKSLLDRATSFIASVQQTGSGAAPVVVTDSDWRVSAGSVVDVSQPEYQVISDYWQPVTGHSYGVAVYANSTWYSLTQDPQARLISPATNGCPSSCPGASYNYLRDSKSFYLTAATQVQVSAICDDNCVVYIDGQPVITSIPWAQIAQQTITLQPGAHHVAVRVYNVAAGSSGVAVSVMSKPANTVLTRTDLTWLTSTSWFGSPPTAFASYDATFSPNLLELSEPPTTMDVIVVGGGGGGGGRCSGCGGGGGGGAGGLIYAPGITPSVGTFTVAVGGAGTGSSSGSSSGGTNGGNSQFGSYIATGGGGGMGQNGTPGRNGGSGGGGAGGSSPPYGLGGSGIAGQGFAGAHGVGSPYGGGGGGGATGFGWRAYYPTTNGDGGSGFITYIDGTRRILAGGGGGGAYNTSYSAGLGDSGTSGNGSNSTTGGSGTVNTGGGGGAGTAGGNGGSGVVYWRFVKGSITVGTIASLSYTNYDVTIGGIQYTVYKFLAGTGTVSITAVN